MGSALLWVLLVVGLLNVALLAVLIARTSASSNSEDVLREELRASREEAARAARDSREELTAALNAANTTLSANLTAMGEMQRTQLDTVGKQVKELGDSNTASLERIRVTLDSRVKELQDGNDKKLEEMRKTVDEKLHDTLEKRLGESFKLVSERLEAVQRGLGEMQSLATGVGDLKRVLTNVKARGTWAEVQLGALLEQILTPSQFARNVQTKEDSARAGRVRHPPARPEGRPQRRRVAADRLEVPAGGLPAAPGRRRARRCGGRAEGDRRAGALDHDPGRGDQLEVPVPAMHDRLRDHVPAHRGSLRRGAAPPDARRRAAAQVPRHACGPTTLAAILERLRMGFQTLAIEQQSAEVWKVLAAVKTEFGKFGDVLVQGQEAAQHRCQHHRRDRASQPGHGAQASRRREPARDRGLSPLGAAGDRDRRSRNLSRWTSTRRSSRRANRSPTAPPCASGSPATRSRRAPRRAPRPAAPSR